MGRAACVNGEADAAGEAEAEAAAFFLLAADKLAGPSAKAATHAAAISSDLYFIGLVLLVSGSIPTPMH